MAAVSMVLLLLAFFTPTVIIGIYVVSSWLPEVNLKLGKENVPVTNDDPAGSGGVAEGFVSPPLDPTFADFSRVPHSGSFEKNDKLMELFHEVSATPAVHEDNVEGSRTCAVMLTDQVNSRVMVFDKFNKEMFSSNPSAATHFLRQLAQVIKSTDSNFLTVSYDPSTGQITTSDSLFFTMPPSVLKAIIHFYEDVHKVRDSAIKKPIDVPSLAMYMECYGCETDCLYNATYDFGSGSWPINLFSVIYSVILHLKTICVGIFIAYLFLMLVAMYEEDEFEEMEDCSDIENPGRITNVLVTVVNINET